MISTSLVGAMGVVSAMLPAASSTARSGGPLATGLAGPELTGSVPAGSGNVAFEVLLHGEHWTGEIETDDTESLVLGSNVEVVSVNGNHLVVKSVRSGSDVNSSSE